ncbi:MMPL family transporter [Nonomuraea longicatena]|uniref:MMPL family transporter n=2 Tax=Nonomuraea longicatena TaxID=83682 RepID=A0ABN1NQ22_9ACTN
MFSSMGRVMARRRWWVVVAALALALVGGIWGSGVFATLTGGAGFDDPGSESIRADEILAGPLGRQAVDVVVLYESDRLTVDDPAFSGPVKQAIERVPRDGITRLESFWSNGGADFVSKDRRATYVAVQLTAADDQARVTELKRIAGAFEAPGLNVRFGGTTAMTEQVNARTGSDIATAELLSMPLLLILLGFVFRNVVAASVPVVVGLVGALGSFVVLRVLTFFLPISSSVINVITILGLGLAIDYALFMISRFRDELATGVSVEEAVERTTATAGRTVAFSGLAVAISFAGLAVFPSRFLTSMGYAGVSVVVFTVLGSLTLLPALLRFAGHRIGRARPRAEAGRWYRAARAMTRRPLVGTLALATVLLGLGAPMLGANWARPAEWVLPSDADARAVTKTLDTGFAANPAKIMTMVVQPVPADLPQYATRLDAVPGVDSAEVTGTHGDQARITLRYAMEPMSPQARETVEGLRAVPAPQGSTALLTGMPASRVDIVNMIGERAVWMVLFVALVSFVVLFLAFGSVLLPLKSVVMNLLSLSAAFGAITLIFQHGYLSDLLGFEPVGAVDANFPVLIVAIAFGLAMDYEVFLLARVREHYDRTGDPAESVALGVRDTAAIITNAALLLGVVVCGFLLSSITLMKMIGVGLIIAIAVDATLVRALLVPATMGLLGHAAWWAPAPLARWWRRHGIRETEAAPAAR